jgi:cytochrome c
LLRQLATSFGGHDDDNAIDGRYSVCSRSIRLPMIMPLCPIIRCTTAARFAAGAIALVLSLVGTTKGQAAGDVAKGREAFVRQCALCHTIGRGEPNRFGPNLFGILDHKAGSVSGFNYSPAFKSAANWDWSAEVLGSWISAPAMMVPGSKMGVFQGVADRDRDDIVAYLAAHR